MNIRLILLALLLIGTSVNAKEVTVQVNGRSVRLDIASPARPDATAQTIVFESGLGWNRSRCFLNLDATQ